MQFENLSELLLMGGHGFYVWTVYAVAFVVLSLMVVIPIRRSRQFFSQQSMLIRREQSAQRRVEK